MGYAPNGYKVYDVESDKFVVARDVIVDEISFMATRPKLIIEETGENFKELDKKRDKL